MKIVKEILKWIVPYQIVLEYQKQSGGWNRIFKNLVELGVLKKTDRQDQDKRKKFEYQSAIEFLTLQGCDPQQVQEGSVPKSSLSFIAEYLNQSFKNQPIIGLHIGNFVGISLAYLTDKIISINSESLLLSIDPNIVHRGIVNPLNLVVGLLSQFGLQNNCLILTGYSLELNEYNEVSKNLENFFDKGVSPGNQLQLLHKLCSKKFDFVMLDGSHEGEYVKRELQAIHYLLRDNGIVFMDDVSVFWEGVKEAYDNVDSNLYEKVAYDGRVGILKKASGKF